jgi:hypothetical protein
MKFLLGSKLSKKMGMAVFEVVEALRIKGDACGSCYSATTSAALVRFMQLAFAETPRGSVRLARGEIARCRSRTAVQ